MPTRKLPSSDEIEEWRRKGIISEADYDKLRNGQPAPVGGLIARPIVAREIETKPRAMVEPSLSEWLGGITLLIPVWVYSGDNARGMKARIGRSGHEKRTTTRTLAKWHREIAPYADRAIAGEVVRVHMIRLGGSGLDTDSLAASMKYVRDAVADFLGCDDGPRSPIIWSYDQVVGDGKNLAGVEVRISE